MNTIRFSGPDLAATVEVCTNPKCERCWHLLPDVGTHAEHSTLCGGGGWINP